MKMMGIIMVKMNMKTTIKMMMTLHNDEYIDKDHDGDYDYVMMKMIVMKMKMNDHDVDFRHEDDDDEYDGDEDECERDEEIQTYSGSANTVTYDDKRMQTIMEMMMMINCRIVNMTMMMNMMNDHRYENHKYILCVIATMNDYDETFPPLRF